MPCLCIFLLSYESGIVRGRESRSLARVGDRGGVVDPPLCHPIASEELSSAIRRLIYKTARSGS